MTDNNSSLVQGHPLFGTRELVTLAENHGNLAAWQQLIAQRGPAAIKSVAGDFAFGFLNVSGCGYLAVDRFAIRSLCYRFDGRGVRFASRADDLADDSSEIDPQAIFDYLYFHVIPSPRTIFKGIYRLPPGHYAVVENGVATVYPYWVAEFPEELRPVFSELRAEFRRLLRDSVACQLDGGKPGCFLSGGTDSSTVAGMIGEVAGLPAATYSIGFEAEGYDEMKFARIAASHFKTEHHEYYVTSNDLVRSIATVAQYYDQPFGNSSALPAYYCAKMAREDGVTRILAGDGGDELFGGNSRYAKQKVFGVYDAVPRLIRQGLLEPVLLKTPIGRLPLVSKSVSYIQQAKEPMPDRKEQYNMLHRLGIGQIFTPDFLGTVSLDAPIKQQRAVWAEAHTGSITNRELAFDWRYTLAECDLPKVVGTTELAGIEVGFPMLDARLLEFSMRLPVSYKLRGLKLRWFFKEALRGFLPDEILTKRKQGFGLPFGVWAAKNAALRGLAEDSVRGLVARRILRADFVDALFKRHLYDHPGYYGEMIWISMMLEQWLRGKDISI